MITLTQFTRSAESARASRMIYEDLALVAHLSELQQVAAIATQGKEERSKSCALRSRQGLAKAFRRSAERVLSVLRPHSHASAK